MEKRHSNTLAFSFFAKVREKGESTQKEAERERKREREGRGGVEVPVVPVTRRIQGKALNSTSCCVPQWLSVYKAKFKAAVKYEMFQWEEMDLNRSF